MTDRASEKSEFTIQQPTCHSRFIEVKQSNPPDDYRCRPSSVSLLATGNVSPMPRRRPPILLTVLWQNLLKEILHSRRPIN